MSKRSTGGLLFKKILHYIHYIVVNIIKKVFVFTSITYFNFFLKPIGSKKFHFNFHFVNTKKKSNVCFDVST